MRNAKAQDYWSKVYRKKHDGQFVKFDLKDLHNFGEIEVPKGIFAICGLNGVGKSTLIAAIKDVIGLPLSKYDINKLAGREVSAIFSSADLEITCTNSHDHRLIDQGWDSSRICYLDSTQSATIQDFLVQQTNLQELLEQYEEVVLESDDIEELNSIIGKHYNSCAIRYLEEIETTKPIPYCQVTINETSYDSRSMGSGEHFLFHLYFSIKNIEKNSILIIEEPETYISIASQQAFIDYLAKQIVEKSITVILSTHSPYILTHIKNSNIRMINRVKNRVNIFTPSENCSPETLLGIPPSNKGTFFVEDRVAYDFLSVILEDNAPYLLREYTIDIANGESGITDRLKFPKSKAVKYGFIGIYDGDMRERLSTDDIQWPYCFLPGDKPVEAIFQEYAGSEEGIAQLSALLQKENSTIFSWLSAIEGKDYHDWFEEFRKLSGYDGRSLVRHFYTAMKGTHFSSEEFLKDLLAKVSCS